MHSSDELNQAERQELELLRLQIAELLKENQQLLGQTQAASSQLPLQSLEQIEQVINQSTDLEDLMEQLLKTTLKIFNCDRAWLIYPCDPNSATWQVLMECTTPEYPGALALKTDLPMTAETREAFAHALESRHPVCYDQKSPLAIPADLAEHFSIQAQLTLAIYPRSGKPWLFGMHQCSRPRVWTAGECQLFETIGRRLPDGFSTFLTTRQLQESEQKYRSLVANLPGVVYRCRNDEHWTVTYLSDAIQELSGYPATDFINNHLRSFASIVHPDDLPQLRDKIEQATSRKQPFEFEYRLQTSTGETRWVHERGKAIFDQQGELQYLDGFICDVTDSKAAKSEIERLEAALAQSEKLLSLGTLATGVAHEINNPLAGILQSLQVVNLRLDKSVEKNRAVAVAAGTSIDAISSYLQQRQIDVLLATAISSGQRAAKIVRDLLHLSRPAECEFSPESLPEILKKALLQAQGSFNFKSGDAFSTIRIEREVPDNFPLLPCDPSQLQQIFLSLLDNGAYACAQKAAQLPAGERSTYQPTILVRLSVLQDQLRAEFIDNGIGIEEQSLPRLFDPFYTTKEPGEGIGLGLSICYFIITKSYRGKMSIEATPGSGSRFIIELPLPQ